jgi:hypothetical protein
MIDHHLLFDREAHQRKDNEKWWRENIIEFYALVHGEKYVFRF